jgi:hypothetical protein
MSTKRSLLLPLNLFARIDKIPTADTPAGIKKDIADRTTKFIPIKKGANYTPLSLNQK